MANERYLSEFGSTVREQLTAGCNWLRENPGATLFIPAGDYILEDARAKEVQDAVLSGAFTGDPEKIMFKPDFVYTKGLDLTGCRDVTVSANGAKILVNGFMEPVSIRNAENVTVSGLTIDHLRKPFTRAFVRTVNDDGSAVIEFDVNTPPEPHMAAPRNYLFDTKHHYITDHFVGWNEQVKHLDGLRYLMPDGFKKEEEGFDIYFVNTFHSRPAILVSHSVNTTLRDVTIHSQPGMGIVGFKSRDILMERIHIVPSEGYHVSTNTDATHFACCSGKVTVLNSTFAGQGDDAINIHNYYYTILKHSKNTCTLKVTAPTGTHAQEPDFPLAGYTLQLVDWKTLKPLDVYTVLSSSETEECEVTLDHDLPDDCIEGCRLANLTELPALHFEGNTVRTHLARGVLCKTHNAVIRNNYFNGGTGTAIHIAAESWWSEGIASKNVLVTGNTIEHTGYTGYGRTNMTCGVSLNIACDAPTYSANHENITIENNTVSCVADAKYAFNIANARHVIVRGNHCTGFEKNVIIDHCEDVETDEMI